MKKRREDKKSSFAKVVEKVVAYLHEAQNVGGCNCGRVSCPINFALYLMEECQAPVEKVAKWIVFLQIEAITKFIKRTK